MALAVSYPSSLQWVCILALTLLFWQCAGDNGGQAEADRVINLPGQPPVDFAQYAGYVTVNQESGRALFYWFFEATQNASQKPLVLWLTGGPGCSSVGGGAALELGPFLVENNATLLLLNEYSWNQEANMLFLESPIGVGFSYTNTSSELKNLGDTITAEDNYAFLLNWLERFPKYKSRDFYITGESYGGHFVPQLAELIFDRNNCTNVINLKGFMVGNAVLDNDNDANGRVDYAWSHAIISDEDYQSLKYLCNSTTGNQTLCNNGMALAYADINIYDLYSSVCLQQQSSNIFSKHALWSTLPYGYDPCSEEYVGGYFNRADVQNALHANTTQIPYPWALCSINVVYDNWNWTDSPLSILPILRKFIKAGLRIWVYSGDTDGSVPVTATRYALNALGLTINEEWSAWYNSQQVGGWTVGYEGLRFLTVRGAGHQVPMFTPKPALAVFKHFLSDSPLPKSRSTS